MKHIIVSQFRILFLMLTCLIPIARPQRLLVAEGRYWSLNEDNFEITDVTHRYDFLPPPAEVIAIDSFRCRDGAQVIGVFRASPTGRRIFIYKSSDGVHAEIQPGEPVGFMLNENFIGFIKLNPASVEDAFFTHDLADGSERLIISGGFFEKRPIVSSRSTFYVFQSSMNRTLQIEAREGTIEEPRFLYGRVVLAARQDLGRYLVEDLDSKRNLILDSQGNILGEIGISAPFAPLAFSSDGTFVYVSVLRSEFVAEAHDLGAYHLAKGKFHLIRKNFFVSPERFSGPLKGSIR